MKAKKLLALLLALCMVVSMIPLASLTAFAASGTLGEGRLTYYDNIREKITNVKKVSGPSDDAGAAKLFDGTFNKMEGNWSNPVTVTFDTTEAVTVTSYTLATNDDGSWSNRQATAWTLYGSTDGTEYTVLDAQSNYKVYNQNNVYFDEDIRVANPGSYSHYKIEFTACAGSYFQCGEFVLSAFDLTGIKAVETEIAALDKNADGFVAAVSTARTSYDALGPVKASVNNTAVLLQAEADVTVAGAEDKENAALFIADVNAITAMAAYKRLTLSTAADAIWANLSENDKTFLASYRTQLDTAKTEYQAAIDAFSFDAGTSRPGTNANDTINAWAFTCSDDVWTATKTALSDAVKYYYSKGLSVDGDNKADYDSWMTDTNANVWHVKLENGADNYNKQDYRSKFTTAVAAFPKMAFVTESAFAQNWTFQNCNTIGEAFDWNGKTYQMMWSHYRSHDTQTPSPDATVPSVTVTNNYPNETLVSTETSKNIFRYAYAKYSQDNRWAGLTLGLPQTQYATSVGTTTTRVQEFNGPQGAAYLFTTAAMISAAPTDTVADGYNEAMDDKYLVVTGNLASVIKSVATTDNLFLRCGDIVSVTADKVTFVNGEITADGFTEFAAEAAGTLQSHIDAIDIDALQVFNDADVQLVRDEYTAATDAVKALVDTTHLEAAEARITELKNGPADLVNLVLAIHNAQAKFLGSVKTTIEGYRSTYEALDEASKAYITNVDELEALEASMSGFTADLQNKVNTWVSSHSTWDKTSGANTVPWMRTGLISTEGMAASAQAIGDEVMYEWKERNLNIGFNGNQGYDNWDGFYIGPDATPNDNLGCPWGSNDGRRVSFVEAVFPGISFSTCYWFSNRIDRNEPQLGNSFSYNGKVYQQFFGFAGSYNDIEIADRNTDVGYANVDVYPGKGAANDMTFRYAYANYNQTNKWDGKYLGLIDGNAVTVGNYSYQRALSDDGNAFIFNKADKMSAVTLAKDASGYIDQLSANAATVVDGELGAALAAVSNDDFARLGNIVSVDATTATFENGTVTAEGIVWNNADYTAVNAAISAVPADLTVYTDATAQAVTDAVNAVVLGKYAYEQTTVNGYATAINNAVAALVYKVADVTIGISEGMITEGSTEGKYNVTWNATVTAGDGTSITDINAAGVTFKSYGVYYAASGETLADYANADPSIIRNKVFNSGDAIDVYTLFGFRLKNITEGATRSAMFYIEYEFNGKTFIVLSSIDTCESITIEG